MTQPLILTTTPAAARAIADALGDAVRQDGYLEAGGYAITWCLGYLADLAKPEAYDAAHATWQWASLPILPDPFRVVPRNDKGVPERLRLIQRLGANAPGIVIGTDPSGEGELTARRALLVCGLADKPATRLWLSSLTPEEIRRAMADLHPASDYDNLFASAEARAKADWLAGINGSRALTLRYQGNKSSGIIAVGRVQTPTLALLVAREREIEAFQAATYHRVTVGLSAGKGPDFSAHWEDQSGNSRLDTQAAVGPIMHRLAALRRATVESASRQTREEPAPQFYDLTALQVAANESLGLSAAATLEAALGLYEAQAITYPRTGSRHVTTAVARTIPAILDRLAGGLCADMVAEADPALLTERCVEDARVADHPAIIPTGVAPQRDGGLRPAEKAVYALIVRQFAAAMMPSAIWRDAVLVLRAGPDRLVARGRTLERAGWRALLSQNDAGAKAERVNPLPLLPVGASVDIVGGEARSVQTVPPRRYTEGDLVRLMETAGQDAPDEEARETLRETGIGTPATRASIIERLKALRYVEAKGKGLAPTPLGRRVIELVERTGVPELTSAELTGQLEARLNRIASGEQDATLAHLFAQDLAQRIVEQARHAASDPARVRSDWPPCPACGQGVVLERWEVRCSSATCKLRVSRKLLQRQLTEDELKQLLEKGRTGLLSGFKGQSGRGFSAVLTLRKDGSGVDFKLPRTGSRRKAAGAHEPE